MEANRQPGLFISRRAIATVVNATITVGSALAQWYSLCVFVNRWALAPGPNSLANSLNTKPEDSDKGFKVSAIGLAPNG